MLQTLFTHVLPDFYTADMRGLQVATRVLRELFESLYPTTVRHHCALFPAVAVFSSLASTLSHLVPVVLLPALSHLVPVVLLPAPSHLVPVLLLPAPSHLVPVQQGEQLFSLAGFAGC